MAQGTLFCFRALTVQVNAMCMNLLNRAVFQQAASLRRAFFDALQLAFSVQMNPLAAVQQVPQAPRGSW